MGYHSPSEDLPPQQAAHLSLGLPSADPDPGQKTVRREAQDAGHTPMGRPLLSSPYSQAVGLKSQLPSQSVSFS